LTSIEAVVPRCSVPPAASTLLYPDVPIDISVIRAIIRTDVSVRGRPGGRRLPLEPRDARFPRDSSTTPRVEPPPKNIKNQGTNPIWRGVCASGLWPLSRAAATSSAPCLPLRWRSLPDQRPIRPRKAVSRRQQVPLQCSASRWRISPAQWCALVDSGTRQRVPHTARRSTERQVRCARYGSGERRWRPVPLGGSSVMQNLGTHPPSITFLGGSP